MSGLPVGRQGALMQIRARAKGE